MQKSRMLLTGGIVSIFALFLFTGVQGCKETARLEEGKYYEEENIEVEGRKYRYVKYCLEHGSGGIRIISMKTEEGELVIPSRLYGYRVMAVGGTYEEIPQKGYSKKDGQVGQGEYAWMKDREQTLERIVISEGILEIEECSFERVHAKQIIIPASMKMIRGLAFGKSVTDSVIIKGKDTNLAGYCFEDSKLNRISMPDDFSGEIGDGCFIGSDIESFQWPAYADKDWDWIHEHIGAYLFMNCQKLKEITFSPKTKKLYFPSKSFYLCSRLKQLVIPKQVEKVHYYGMPYAENYKEGVGTLVFQGKDTEIRTWAIEIRTWDFERTGSESDEQEITDYITVSKIIAPKNSKAIEFAKGAKKVKYISEDMQQRIRYDGDEIQQNFTIVEDEYKMMPLEYEER